MAEQQQLQDPLQRQVLSAPEPEVAAPALEDPLAEHSLGDPLTGSLQLSSAGPPGGGGDPTGARGIASAGLSGGGGRLPHFDAIQDSFGHHDVSGVKAHTGGAAKRASLDLNANGFALGDSVALGKSDLFTTAHEAAHTVQQRSGLSLADGMGRAGDAHEQHADAVARKVVSGESAEGLLDRYTAGAPSAVGGGGGGVQLLQKDEKPLSESDQTALVQGAAQDLGEVDSMQGMQRVIGGVLDALAPGPGGKRKLQLKVDVSCSPVVTLGLAYGVEISRDEDGKLKVKSSVDFSASAKADLWVAEAIIKANVGGYVEARGASGAHIMSLLGLAIHQAIAAVSESAAEYVFGEGFDDGVRSTMDDKDYVESGITAGVSGGIGLSGEVGGADVKASGAAQGSGKLGMRHTASGSKAIAEASAGASAKVSASVSGKLPNSDWKGKATLSAEAATGKDPYGQIEFSLGRDADVDEFVGAMKGGKMGEQVSLWASGAASMATGLIGEHAGMNIGGSRTLSQVVSDMGAQTLSASVAGGGLLDDVHERLGTKAGAEMKQELSIKLKWQAGKAKLDMGLSRTSKLKVSADVKAAKIEVLIENVMRLVQIPTVTF